MDELHMGFRIRVLRFRCRVRRLHFGVFPTAVELLPSADSGTSAWLPSQYGKSFDCLHLQSQASPVLTRGEGEWLDAGSFVRAIAERLVLRTTATTEVVLPALFELDVLGSECRDDRLCHVISLPVGCCYVNSLLRP
jgi:hypothetical protein